MILRITPQVIENALLPEPLHGVPILNLAIVNWIAEVVGVAGAGAGQGVLPDEEVEIGHDAGAVLRHPVPLGGVGPGLAGEGVVDGDDGGGDEAGLHVPGEPHLRVPGAVVDDDGGAGGGVHGVARGPTAPRRRSRSVSQSVTGSGEASPVRFNHHRPRPQRGEEEARAGRRRGGHPTPTATSFCRPQQQQQQQPPPRAPEAAGTDRGMEACRRSEVSGRRGAAGGEGSERGAWLLLFSGYRGICLGVRGGFRVWRRRRRLSGAAGQMQAEAAYY